MRNNYPHSPQSTLLRHSSGLFVFIHLHCFFSFFFSDYIGIFNNLQKKIGIDHFKKILPVILTDRDPSFSDITGIECDYDTGELRTRLFFCDAFKSNQKASVENMNKQLRKYFPKKSSVDHLTDEDMKNVMNFINNLRVPSLSGFTPNESFIRVYGKELLYLLTK